MVDVVDLLKDARDRRTAALILELDLTDGILEGQPADPLSVVLGMRRPNLRDVLDGLRRARTDRRVRALVVKVGGHRVGLATAQELRDAIRGFREAGKPTVAWSESFGEISHGTVPYFLATACERIYMQPSGSLVLTGVALQEPFLHDALDRLGVTPRFAKRHEYKTAVNTFSERAYTPEHREASERIVTSVAEQVVKGVAEARGLPEARVRELIDEAPLLGAEALEAGLVDGLAYRDEVYAKIRGDARPRYVSRYNRAHTLVERIPRPRQEIVALIQGQGPIKLGRSGRAPIPGQPAAMGSDTVGAALRAAARDERVKAIVLRIDSPGGSYVASDTIWREVGLAREAGKPVIVSMGNVAASGGYYISAPADAIVAQPGTLTGSIGVYHGKPVISGLLDRLGIGIDSVEVGAHARMSGMARDFTEDEWERINAFLDHVYDDFVGKVAAGRDLPRERVHELARGRVWTGADARERGLVDELGGLDLATDIARKRSGLPADAPIRPYPHVSPLDRLRPADSSEDRTAAGARLDPWGPLSGIAARIGLPAGGPLMLPGPWEPR
jgi:protease IV